VGGYSDYSYRYGSTPLLMPLLLDLAPEETGRGDAFVRQEADRLIVTWDHVPGFYRREAVFTFQAILYRSGVFEFSYDGLPAALPYRPDDEPSANVWVIGAVPGDAAVSGQSLRRLHPSTWIWPAWRQAATSAAGRRASCRTTTWISGAICTPCCCPWPI
jgi:hypothetical protein